MLFLPCYIHGQETEPPDPVREQQLENLVEKQDAETKDDSYWQQLEGYNKHRINLNSTTADDLDELKILTALQISYFLHYRQALGKLVNIYELQAVPGWDIETIKRLLPYITVGDHQSLTERFQQRMRGGDHSFLLRTSKQLEKSKGFEAPVDSGASHYLGSSQRIFFRYQYNYKNVLQYGILGDKDAGEQFFRGRQPFGFDFYSFHFYIKNSGIIKAFALGDFTVNMGQGLIQWQTLAFTKSADVLFVKRQSATIRPYHSTGEFNFHRGAAITLKKGKFEATGFISLRKISANLAADTSGREDLVSSFETSGYHRTQAENADKNDLKQTAAGASASFLKSNYHVSINAVQYYFSHSIQKQDQPYNLFAIRGNSWRNISADYSYTHRNVHLFGEVATDKNMRFATVHGLLASLHPNVDFSIVYRNLAKDYQSLYANAFTENITPSNESGLYTGISIRPFAGLRADVYADIYKTPWLKYSVDAPGFGKDFFVQLFYQPGKTWSVYTRFKNESKQANTLPLNAATHQLTAVTKQDWRTEYSIRLNREMTIRNRVEILWYDKKQPDHEQGFLELVDFLYHPGFKPVSGNIRLQYFETSGYNSRVYAYENDVLYNFSIPFFYNRGFAYYLNLHGNLKKILRLSNRYKMKLEGWVRWSQSLYPANSTIGSGLDQIYGTSKSEIKFQVMVGW